MKRLEKIILVQFFVCDAEEIEIQGHTAFMGQNAAGKTSLLDAIQIVMLGTDRRYLQFNAKKTAKENLRNIRDYCLGCYKSGGVAVDGEEQKKLPVLRKRDSANTYITLVFRDEVQRAPISVGVAITATADKPDHEIKGMFVASGLALTVQDHIEQMDGNSFRPLKWKEFEAGLNKMAEAAGITPEITTQPEKHVRSMLHVLQPKGASINSADYQKAFKKSVHLSDIANVSEFVRDFLIEEEAIDKKKAMEKVAEFRRLQGIIEDIKEQIGILTDLGRKFEAVQRNEARLATINALSYVYRVEAAGAAADRLIDQISEANEDHSTEQALVQELNLSAEQKSGELQEIQRQLDSDNAQARKQELMRLRQGANTQKEQLILGLQRIVEPLPGALLGLSVRPLSHSVREAVSSSRKALENSLEELALGNIGPLVAVVRQLVDQMPGWVQAFHPQVADAEAQAQAAQRFYEEECGSVENLRRGGIDLTGAVARAVNMLFAAGVDARPVCEAVRVRDPKWQPAIESVLGDLRFALITDGSCDEAIRHLAAAGIKGVTVVDRARPALLPPLAEYAVARLVEGSDPAAAAFVQAALGQLRMSESHEDALEQGESLTADGLLCRSGGATLLQRPATLMLGLQRRMVDEASLTLRLQNALSTKLKVQEAAGLLRKAFSAVDGLDMSVLLSGIEHDGHNLGVTSSKVEEFDDLIAAIDTGESDLLVARKDSLREEIEEFRRKENTAREKAGKLLGKIELLKEEKEKVEAEAIKAAAHQKEAIEAQDFDPALLSEMREKHDIDVFGKETSYEERLTKCHDLYQRYNNQKAGFERAAFEVFTPFVNRYGYDVIDERTDWRKALPWVQIRMSVLEDSDLVLYEGEAKQARLVAEDSFRQDIALRIRGGIQRMQDNIREMNKLLDACPPFSNNEKFTFKAWVPEIHKPLYRFIMDADGHDSTANLLRPTSEIDTKIVEMLMSGSEQGGEKTPLDDFRLMFNFDLLISDGVHTTALSKRIGAGSNGEHKTPFYVIAAAALAHAFRIDDRRKQPSGTALMLLDEAFGDMDGTNATATAKFISSLGIQMLMAAPSEAMSKVLGFTNTIYELDRFNGDLYFSREVVTEKGHALMRSDMPSENPDLLTAKIQEYS